MDAFEWIAWSSGGRIVPFEAISSLILLVILFVVDLNIPVSLRMSQDANAENIRGKRLVVTTIDDIAHSDPERVFFAVPQDDADLSKGFHGITCRQFVNAINHAAHWLQTAIGELGSMPSEVLGYQAPMTFDILF